MRVFRKTVLVGFSLLAFVFMLPLEFVRAIAKNLSKGKFELKGISEVYAEVFSTMDEALKTLLPGASDIKEEVKALTAEQKKIVADKAKVEFDPENDKDYHFYVSSSGTAVLNTVKGKWGPIKFMMSFNEQGKIKDLVVLELTERRGRPVKERRFLDQYIGKSGADPIKLNKDIKGIAGATISSRQMSDGIRKLVNIYELLYRK